MKGLCNPVTFLCQLLKKYVEWGKQGMVFLSCTPPVSCDLQLRDRYGIFVFNTTPGIFCLRIYSSISWSKTKFWLSQHPAHCVKNCHVTSVNFMLFCLVLLLVNTMKSHSLLIFILIFLLSKSSGSKRCEVPTWCSSLSSSQPSALAGGVWVPQSSGQRLQFAVVVSTFHAWRSRCLSWYCLGCLFVGLCFFFVHSSLKDRGLHFY